MSHVMLIFACVVSSLLSVLIRSSTAVVIANSTQSCTVSCEIASNIQDYGFDANKQQLQVDLKQCVKVYLGPPGTDCVSREEEQSCQKQCSPRSYQLDWYTNRTGPFVVKTIKRCHANTHHCQNCQRKPHRFYVFPGSKYQQRIDVGKCAGVCNEEGSASDETTPSSLTCLPTRTRSLSVEGPNGHVTVEVIENCSCVSDKCYRADYFQSVSVRGPDNRRQEELVNTGKCVGSCQGFFIDARCLQYLADGRCAWYLPGIRGKCRPTRGSAFAYTDLSGTNQTLPVVDECGCTTG